MRIRGRQGARCRRFVGRRMDVYTSEIKIRRPGGVELSFFARAADAEKGRVAWRWMPARKCVGVLVEHIC